MSIYTFKQLIHDCCSSKRSRIQGTTKEKEEILKEVWASLNSWVLSRFSKGKVSVVSSTLAYLQSLILLKGVNIGTFARITWETCTVRRNMEKKRPIFLLSESFARNNGMPFKRKLVAPKLEPMEDINFTKLAIKFSRNLTKDTVFSGVRDLIQKLGQVIGSGRRVAIDMDIGKLIAKNRSVHLVFDPNQFPRDIASLVTPSILGAPPSELGDLDDFFTLELDDIPEKQPQSPAAVEATVPETLVVEISEERAATPAVCAEGVSDTTEALDTMIEQITANKGFLTKEIECERDSLTDCEAVLHEAYKRHLKQLELEITQDSLAALEVHKQHSIDCRLMKNERDHKKRAAESFQETIRQQIKENSEFRQQERTAPIATGTGSIIPATEHEIVTAVGLTKKYIPEHVRKAHQRYLRSQIDAKQKLIQEDRQKLMLEEREFLQKVSNELELEKSRAEDNRRKQRQFLTEGWKRDKHVKNIIRVRRQQLMNQVNGPKAKVAAPRETPWETSTNLDDYSVGFDIRDQ